MTSESARKLLVLENTTYPSLDHMVRLTLAVA
jgi:hypothetical protein